ncbi:flavin-containing monooxygenase [Rhizorhapis suberifaciens]|uniref:Putative flavoprotein involved in K+ transport n=1 Tax=Rhizorhapis suberifaciens TaxID=13656 RepID=A0A840HRK3_9SPHN|nr:NAD(P)/FAD-dependent oxidoreductase [Rhizorhapis suberifaciens]MBB4640174.1 putative flavoprotein involved in K+ transport [Rhizorhapis suberifaciens]
MNDLQVETEAVEWVSAFDDAIGSRDAAKLKDLFSDPAYFRDNGALTWDYRQFHGRDVVVSTLVGLAGEIQPHRFRISSDWPAPNLQDHGGNEIFEAFFDFDTKFGKGVLVLNAVRDGASSRLRARAIFTRLEDLHGTEPLARHPAGRGYVSAHPGQTWKQHRDAARQYLDREPEVVVVGAGQAGLTTAACLRRLGVDVLNIDRYDHVGDSWNKRYDALYLHNPIEMNGFPFLPFPPHYPQYLPKDLIGDWLDIYARYMDLTVWTGTEFVSATYDASADRWDAVVRSSDGTERELHPRHIVWATGGIGGKPFVPTWDGIEAFAGKVMHSSQYTGAADYGIKKAIIIGVATSAHDIARNLHDGGVEVTMFQRGPVVVNNVDTANLAYAGYLDPAIPTELVDLRYGIGLINPLRESASRAYHTMAQDIDRELLDGLKAAGLELGDGVDGQGWLDLFLRTGGGYYLNTGTSELIAAGKIKIEQFKRIVEFVPAGVELDDGSIVQGDIIVLATGYQSRKSEVASVFGQDIGDRVGEIARLDPEGEWASMWGQTGQRGLWFNGGGINQMRPGSQRLALLIKADLAGYISETFRRKANG